MKKTFLFLTAAGLLGFAACKKDNNTPGASTGPTANAMFVHTVMNADTLKIKINDTLQNSVLGMTFLNNSGYKSVRSGNVKATYYFPSTGGTLVEATQALTQSAHYSFFAIGNVTAPEILFSADDLTAPSSGKAKVRFANLSVDNMKVDCYVGTPKVQSAISYKTITAFSEVDAGSNISIMMNNKDTITLKGELTNQNILAGKIYTFMLTGTRNGSGNAALKLTMINNN